MEFEGDVFRDQLSATVSGIGEKLAARPLPWQECPLDTLGLVDIINASCPPQRWHQAAARTLKEMAFQHWPDGVAPRQKDSRGWPRCETSKPLSRVRRDQFCCRLLGTTNLAIKEVAAVSGFTSASEFCHAFRRLHGVSASEYRKLADATLERG